MKYEIKNINNKYIVNINYESFDYYSNSPKSFNELTNTDRKFLTNLLKLNDNKLYVLANMQYFKDFNNESGLWDYHALPNQSPEDDFKYEVKFSKPLSENKIIGQKYVTFIGVAEITIDFYLNNYLFFNRGNGTVIFLCNEEDIEKTISRINEFSNKLSEEDNIISFSNFLELVDRNCIFITLQDDEESKKINVIVKEKDQLEKIIDCISV